MGYKLKAASIIGRMVIPEIFDRSFQKPKVLFYHGVEQNVLTNKRVQGNQIPMIAFEKQIAYLKKYNEIISIDEFYNRMTERKIAGREVVITFDDGYKNNLTIAAPLLKSLNVPFTVFIPTNNITTGDRLPTFYVRGAVFSDIVKLLDLPSLQKRYHLRTLQDCIVAEKEIIGYAKSASNSEVLNLVAEIKSNLSQDELTKICADYESEELMNWDEVAEITSYGATIGSHTLDHTLLHKKQSKEETIAQLKQSKDIIEEKIGYCDYFAYPNGDSNSVCAYSLDEVLSFYKMGFGTTGKAVTDLTDLSFVRRIGACGDYHAFKTQLFIA